MKNKESILSELKKALDLVSPGSSNLEYPKEALPVGTYARSTRLKRLGLVVDAFYGDVDEDGKRIVVYTLLLFPDSGMSMSYAKDSDHYYLSNEYEYETIGYLMMNPVDVSEIMMNLGKGVYL